MSSGNFKLRYFNLRSFFKKSSFFLTNVTILRYVSELNATFYYPLYQNTSVIPDTIIFSQRHPQNFINIYNYILLQNTYSLTQITVFSYSLGELTTLHQCRAIFASVDCKHEHVFVILAN